MGFEAFRVELRGGSVKAREAESAIRQLPQVKSDQQAVPMKGSTFYVVNDGRHAIELELMESPLRLSCRFTLCHPPSVDSAFLSLVREMMRRLEMDAKICDDVHPEHARSFPLAEFADFSAIAARSIAARRSEWIAAFGDEPLAATTNDVYRKIVLPRCQIGIEQPT